MSKAPIGLPKQSGRRGLEGQWAVRLCVVLILAWGLGAWGVSTSEGQTASSPASGAIPGVESAPPLSPELKAFDTLVSPKEPLTSATAEISAQYAAARIQYLRELQKIQNREIESLSPLARGAKAGVPLVQKGEGSRGFWDQVTAGTNVLTAIWRFQFVRLAGEPVTVGKIILGLFVLVAGLFLAGRVTRLFRSRVLSRLRVDENALVALEKAFLYVFVLFIILFSLQVVSIPLSLFAFLGGAVALAFGFGAQNILNNFISGWILMLERPIRIGDLIEIEGHYGSVETIGARCARVRLFTGIHILVPNSNLLEKTVINWTLSDDNVRVYVSVGVAYGSPTKKVKELILQAVNEHAKILREPAPIVLFEEFGDSALLFEVHFWVSVRQVMDSRIVKSDVRYRIDELLRQAGITIAFPQRDVHLDTASPLEVRLLGSGEKSSSEGHDS